MNELNKSLKIQSPFIVENGACIFFPKITIKFFLIKNFFKHSNYFGYKLTKKNSQSLISEINHLKKNINLVFLVKLVIFN